MNTGLILMRRKNLVCTITFLLFAVWLTAMSSSGAAATTTTVEFTATMSGPKPTMLPAGDDEGHVVGLGTKTGKVVFDDGRTAEYSNVFFMDLRRGVSVDVWGYTKFLFEDGSWIYFKWTAAPTGRDENGPLMAGTGTVLKGTGAYEGIQGSVEFKNRRLPPPEGGTEARSVMTYTLP